MYAFVMALSGYAWYRHTRRRCVRVFEVWGLLIRMVRAFVWGLGSGLLMRVGGCGCGLVDMGLGLLMRVEGIVGRLIWLFCHVYGGYSGLVDLLLAVCCLSLGWYGRPMELAGWALRLPKISYKTHTTQSASRRGDLHAAARPRDGAPLPVQPALQRPVLLTVMDGRRGVGVDVSRIGESSLWVMWIALLGNQYPCAHRRPPARMHACGSLLVCVFAGRVYACELCIIGRMLLCRFGRESCTISGLMQIRGWGPAPAACCQGHAIPC